MKIKHLFTPFFLLLFVSANAQKSDVKAKKWITKIISKIEKSKNTYMKFELHLPESKLGALDQNKMTGEIYINSKKYHLSIGDFIFIKQDSIKYTINLSDREITLQRVAKNDMQNPYELLLSLKKNYRFSSDILKKLPNKVKIQYIKFTPNKKSDIKNILIGFNSKNYEILEIYQTTASDKTSSTFIKKIKYNTKLPTKNFYSLDKKKYKDFYISDLRI